jgi:hypothetical protein
MDKVELRACPKSRWNSVNFPPMPHGLCGGLLLPSRTGDRQHDLVQSHRATQPLAQCHSRGVNPCMVERVSERTVAITTRLFFSVRYSNSPSSPPWEAICTSNTSRMTCRAAVSRTTPPRMAVIYSELFQNVQDKFNEAGVEILSPHYTALRDGHHTMIPQDYLPKAYRPPSLRISSSPDDGDREE